MSDLATTLDAQGRFDEACVYVQKASDLARQIEHPELHMLLSNLAAILMHRGRAPPKPDCFDFREGGHWMYESVKWF